MASPQHLAYAPVRGYAGGAYAAPDPDPMDTSRMAPPANKPFECYRCGSKDHLARNCTNKPKPGYTDSDGTPHHELLKLQVVKLSSLYNIFIGYDWLERHNPVIDWT